MISASSMRARELLVTLAEDVLSERMDILAGVRQLVAVWARVEEEEGSFFLPVIAVESETDFMPTEKARSLWEPVALARREEEVAPYLEAVRPIVEAVCEEIVRRYGPSAVTRPPCPP